jgi:hypothetical protein
VQITEKWGDQIKTDNVEGNLYFTKYRQEGIWMLDVNAQLETRVFADVNRSENFKFCPRSLYYLVEKDDVALWQMNLKTAKAQQKMSSAINSKLKFELADDCQKLSFSKCENIESDIVMLKI